MLWNVLEKLLMCTYIQYNCVCISIMFRIIVNNPMPLCTGFKIVNLYPVSRHRNMSSL